MSKKLGCKEHDPVLSTVEGWAVGEGFLGTIFEPK